MIKKLINKFLKRTEIIIESDNKKYSIYINKQYEEKFNNKFNNLNFESTNRVEILYLLIVFLQSLKERQEAILKELKKDDEFRNTIIKNIQVIEKTIKIHEDNIKNFSS